MLACCGLECGSCPIHLATLESDEILKKRQRESIAELLVQEYGMNLAPEAIDDCDGCRATTGRLFSGCLDCRIRPCVLEQNLENCSDCNGYPCELLLEHFILDPSARERLDEIRALHKGSHR